MNKIIVVDTDLIIDLLRGVPEAKEFFNKIKTRGFIAYYSSIVEAEIFSGQSAGTPEEEKIIENLLKLMTRLDINGAVAKKAGEFRRKYGCSMPDALIAATAITNNIHTIATRNKKHFDNIKDVNVLVPY